MIGLQLTVFALLLGAGVESPREDGLTIDGRFDGRIVIWNVVNDGGDPLVGAEIPTYRVYNHVVPDGWTFVDSEEVMNASAVRRSAGSTYGRALKFSVQGISSNSVPTLATARLHFGSGRVVERPGVPTLMPESRLPVLVPPVIVSAIAIVQLVLRRR